MSFTVIRKRVVANDAERRKSVLPFIFMAINRQSAARIFHDVISPRTRRQVATTAYNHARAKGPRTDTGSARTDRRTHQRGRHHHQLHRRIMMTMAGIGSGASVAGRRTITCCGADDGQRQLLRRRRWPPWAHGRPTNDSATRIVCSGGDGPPATHNRHRPCFVFRLLSFPAC